jgi:hemerythrin-like domain-containing protein
VEADMARASVRAGGAGKALAIGSVDPRLLGEPIEYLEAEHYRVRAVISLLERLESEMRSDVRAAMAQLVVDFIRSDLALHLTDEEEGLFPLLRMRCEISDGIELILERIAGEPARSSVTRAKIAHTLEAARPDRAIDDGLRVAIEIFILSQRRLLALEDTSVLPLARRRLTDADQRWLSHHMSERRQ